MTVDQLPYGTKNDYACMFDGVEVDVDSSDSTRIQCTTPPSGADLPQIPRDDQGRHFTWTNSTHGTVRASQEDK